MRIAPLLIVLILLPGILVAQTGTEHVGTAADSAQTDTTALHFNAPWPDMAKSALLPGWGQLGRNNLKAAGLSLSYLYFLSRGIKYNADMADYAKHTTGWNDVRNKRNKFLILGGLTASIAIGDVFFSRYFTYLDKTEYRSPKGAMYRSFFLPGWGQFYNGKWLKALIIGGVEVYYIGGIFVYNSWKNDYKDYPDYYELYQDQRNKHIWYSAMVMLYSGIDAFVDAYLDDFDKDMNLSMGFDMQGSNTICFDICLHF